MALWSSAEYTSRKCYLSTGNFKITKRVISRCGFPDLIIQPASHERHACCLLPAEQAEIQPSAERAASFISKILGGP